MAIIHEDSHYVGANLDPFNTRTGSIHSFLNALFATALFRCWHFILMFTAWATVVCLITDKVHNISFQPTLLTVLGTVLGFVISYRTSSSFERYNEGRRLWSAIIQNSRVLARTVWFHVPDVSVLEGSNEEEKKARTLVEKKTVLNLIEAFAVAVKHYLRGEEGINYVDLYHLTKFLPAYALPAGLPPPAPKDAPYFEEDSSDKHLPLPATSPRDGRFSTEKRPIIRPKLLPARNPPKWSLFDVWPLTNLVPILTKRGVNVGGRVAARERAKSGRGRDGEVVSHNVPLEITLYLSSYVSALQKRKMLDAPTTSLLLNTISGLSDSLTGLERILTTPIPFSYSVHLWTVTLVYCFFLPMQLWRTLFYLTIPGTAITTFILTGLLEAGEEIENPFGFDKNDLDLDHFCHNIVHAELTSITSVPVPDPGRWAFVAENDALFATDNEIIAGAKGPAPTEWVKSGVDNMRKQLTKAGDESNAPPAAPAGHAAAGQAGAGGAAGGAAGSGADGGGGGGGD